MRFTKMHGAGNDYIYVDCFAEPVPENLPELARKMSDRHFGVGGDGLILICPSERADAEMRMFNADGSPGEMCGNGIRCVAKYLYDRGLCRRENLQIESAGQVLALTLFLENGQVVQVRVDMGEPILIPEKIPTTLGQGRGRPGSLFEEQGQPGSLLEGHDGQPGSLLEEPIDLGGREVLVTPVSMGNPHAVVFVETLTDDWVLGVGPQLEIDPHFPKRVNVEFVEVLARNEVRQRTWERGSGETWACGTGAAAVCVAGVLTGRTDRKVLIHLLGGDLQLEWNEADNHVFMTGPAVEVFSGEWP